MRSVKIGWTKLGLHLRKEIKKIKTIEKGMYRNRNNGLKRDRCKSQLKRNVTLRRILFYHYWSYHPNIILLSYSFIPIT